MQKIMKRIGIGLLGLVLLLVLGVFIISSTRLSQGYENFEISFEPIAIPTDSEAVAHGEHIAVTRYCGTCHGEDLSGDFLLNEPVLSLIHI